MKVNLFHIGPQKSATTWFFNAIRHHPDVATPPKDAIYYFDMLYPRRPDWLHRQFPEGDFRCYLDPTPTYIRDRDAARRIHVYNPEARIIFTARNPLKRAFSHYWHEKKKDKIKFRFEEVLENYDLFASWILPGMHARNYKTYREFFPAEQIHIIFFDDISADPAAVMNDACSFAGLSPFPRHDLLLKKVNVASGYKSTRRRALEQRVLRPLVGRTAIRRIDHWLGTHTEMIDSVDPSILAELKSIFDPDVREFEALTGRDLSAWLR